MSKYNNFQSQSELDYKREETRKARELILEQAKKKYEIEEARKEKSRKQGEGTWMLDSVSERIKKEEKERAKSKKKKSKKKKKEKKKKKTQSSSSSSESEEENWTEVSATTAKAETSQEGAVKGPQLQRESWMEAPIDLIPMTSRQDIRAAAQKQKEEARREAEKMSAPGQHTRELNPYWKDGGTGLPEEKKETPQSGPISGDGGVSWLRKAYDRCKQQAEEEGRDLEEVAAERWGSLKKLKSMLAEAENKLREERSGKREGGSHYQPHRDKDREAVGNRGRDRERWNDRDRSPDRSHNRSRDRSAERDRRESHSDTSRNSERRRDNENQRGHIDKDGRRSKFQRPGSDSEEENSRDKRFRFIKPGDDRRDSGGSRRSNDNGRSKFRRPGSDSEEEERGKRSKDRDSTGRKGFMRPGDSEDVEMGSRRNKQFMKPGEDNRGRPTDRGNSNSSYGSRAKRSDEDVPRWKKKSAEETSKKSEEDFNRRNEDRERKRDDERKDKRSENKERRRSLSSSSGSSSSNSDSGHSDDNSDSDTHNRGTAQPPMKILTEEELNDLAAKILRAEIMGDDDLASNLKSQLENARKQREASKSGDSSSAPDFSHRRRKEESGRDRRRKRDDKEEEDDNVVVLSRTSKGGMVRPVLGSSDQWGAGGRGGKRRKKNVTTHNPVGERTIYFDNDDKLDLKTMVEQEKAGTAEDQNAMFARLAGRSTDRDLDVDDIFINKAAKQQNTEQAANKDRAAAIFEHRKVTAAMEKCHRCFDKIPKHLIIAIGSKSYLCLPHHRSLVEGHCLIVPMQHVSAATSMDEDVWQEMQLFRKSLVQMFASQDQDMVIMETVMHLKHFPHTALEVIPLDKELGDLSPIYFKKAIQEVGPEWSDNKKLHSLSEKDVRHVIPKGFPYFSVDFGLQGGYATVIEDEASFPAYFGREIVGGMLDAEPTLWRKPHKQSFEDQRQKVLQFEKMWRQYDWTQNLSGGD